MTELCEYLPVRCNWLNLSKQVQYLTLKWLQRDSNPQPLVHKQTLTIWPVWLNGWVFVYELSGCEFESRCTHLNVNLYPKTLKKEFFGHNQKCAEKWKNSHFYFLLYYLPLQQNFWKNKWTNFVKLLYFCIFGCKNVSFLKILGRVA